MKKISILMFLPLLVFGQPTDHLQNDLAYVDFKMEVNVQIELEGELNSHKLKDHSIAVLANMKTPVTYDYKNVVLKTTAEINIPIHLNTFSLSGQRQVKHRSLAPQERLDYLLALNDLEFPKEDTLLKGLSPVRYKISGFGGAENMPEGFGLKIRL